MLDRPITVNPFQNRLQLFVKGFNKLHSLWLLTHTWLYHQHTWTHALFNANDRSFVNIDKSGGP